MAAKVTFVTTIMYQGNILSTPRLRRIFSANRPTVPQVDFFAKRRNDKEQKRMDLIKEKRNRERQTENDVFVDPTL